jgi:hypothetical protein
MCSVAVSKKGSVTPALKDNTRHRAPSENVSFDIHEMYQL